MCLSSSCSEYLNEVLVVSYCFFFFSIFFNPSEDKHEIEIKYQEVMNKKEEKNPVFSLSFKHSKFLVFMKLSSDSLAFFIY